MTKIYTETFGQGKAIVLVHGWAMHSGIWRGFAEELAAEYQVTLVDLPGHGRSAPLMPFTLESVAKVLVDSVADGACCWLGWSLGAEIVLAVSRYFPERVSQIVLLAGNPRFIKANDWPGLEESVLDKFTDQLRQDCRGTLLRFLSLQITGTPENAITLRALKKAVFDTQEPDLATIEAALDILKFADLRNDLADLKIPIAVVLGTLDTLVPVALAEKLRALHPEIALTIIDRAGHLPFLSHPQAVLMAIRQFLENKPCK